MDWALRKVLAWRSTGTVTTSQALPLLVAENQFRINASQANDQADSQVTMLDGGGYVVTWRSASQDGSGYGVYGQRFSVDGVAAGNEFRINGWTANDQSAPAITATRNGGFAVFWQSGGDQDGSGQGVYAQRYDAQGVALGKERRINVTTSDDQEQICATRLADDRLVVVYTSQETGVGTSILGRIYDPDLQQFGSDEIAIGDPPTETTAQLNSTPDITALTGGGFVVVWHTYNGDTSNLDVVMRRFDSDGNRLGSETVVHNADALTQKFAHVTGLNDGGYVVTWQSGNAAGDTDALARIFNADGSARSAQFQVSSANVGDQAPSDIITLANGDFLIACTAPDASDAMGVYARRFTAAGAPVGDDIWLAQSANGYQLAPSLSARADGGFITTFGYPDASYSGITARVWDGAIAPLDTVIIGGGGNDALTGDATADRIVGLGGDDVLSGGGGNDLLEGGDGADTLIGGQGGDYLFGGSGDDTYVVDDTGDVMVEAAGAGIDGVRTSLAAYTLGDNIENLTFIGGGAFTGGGNALDNAITGGGGADVLDGGAGADTLIGGAGDDTLIGGGGLDTVVYTCRALDVTFTTSTDGWLVTDLAHGAGADALSGIEQVQFDDRMIYLDGRNNAPLIEQALVISTNEDVVTTALNLLGGASDFEGQTLSVANFVQSNGPTAVVARNGADFEIDPTQFAALAEGETATLTFGYDIFDGVAATAQTLTVMIAGRDEPLQLTGTAGNDVLTGGAAADTLAGAAGSDTLTGGLVGDVFRFNAPGEGLDVITDFQTGVDVIEVASAGFDSLPIGQLDTSRFVLDGAGDVDTRFIFNTVTKVLSYDADGVGEGAAVGLVNLNVATLGNTSIFIV